MNRPEFYKAMAVLEAGTGKGLDENKVDVWFDCLADLTVEQLQAGVVGFLRDGDDWPTIAKIRRHAGLVAISNASRASTAWAAVLASIAVVGGYRDVVFDDPVATAVVRRLGGWKMLCDYPAAEIKWVKKDFLIEYQAVIDVGVVTAEMSAPLTGIGSATGRVDVEPKRIACGLPDHPPMLRIEAPVVKALPAPSAETKRIAENIGRPLPVEREPVPEAVPAVSKDNQVAALRSMIEGESE